MRVNRLEAHDRYQHLIKDQSQNVFQGAEDCMKKNPLSLSIQEKSPYVYIFGHPRTADDGVTKIMYWQPRLSIPPAQPNSYLFRATSKTDLIEVIWLIPPKEMWGQYKKGNVTEDQTVEWCINQFKNDKQSLEKPHPQDFAEEKSKSILKQIINEHIQQLKNNSKPEPEKESLLMFKQEIEGAF